MKWMTRYDMIWFAVTSHRVTSRHVLCLPLGEVDASRAMRTDPNDSELELPLKCTFELEFELEFGLFILIVDSWLWWWVLIVACYCTWSVVWFGLNEWKTISIQSGCTPHVIKVDEVVRRKLNQHSRALLTIVCLVVDVDVTLVAVAVVVVFNVFIIIFWRKKKKNLCFSKYGASDHTADGLDKKWGGIVWPFMSH